MDTGEFRAIRRRARDLRLRGRFDASAEVLAPIERHRLDPVGQLKLDLALAELDLATRRYELCRQRLRGWSCQGSSLSPELRARLRSLEAMAAVRSGSEVPTESLYALLEEDLPPLARGQVLLALQNWQRVINDDHQAAAELSDAIRPLLPHIEDLEWRSLLVAHIIPLGGARQWDERYARLADATFRATEERGWHRLSFHLAEARPAFHTARDELDQVEVWLHRIRDLGDRLGNPAAHGLYHWGMASVQLAAGEPASAIWHWELYLARQDEVPLTPWGRRLVELMQVLIDHAGGHLQTALERVDRLRRDPDSPHGTDLLGPWIRVLVEAGPPEPLAAALAEAFAQVEQANDPYYALLLDQAARTLDGRGDVPLGLRRQLHALTHRIASQTGHRRILASSVQALAAPAPAEAGSLRHWQLVRRLGSGAMGEAWLATDGRDQHPVVLKLLLPEAAHDLRMAEGLFQEARSMARLTHRNILQVLDYGRIDTSSSLTADCLIDGAPYLVSPYAAGGDLGRVLGRWPWLKVRRALLDTLAGLAHAHAQGVVHLDIKPDNLLLDADGTVRIADFGIARAVGFQRDRVAGTPRYMAPEQWRGHWQLLGPWTDLYALGIVATELVQRHGCFGEGDVGFLRDAHLHHTPTIQPTTQVPEGFEDWVMRLVAKSPEERFPSAALAAQALRALPDAPEGPAPTDTGPPIRDEDSIRTVVGTQPWCLPDPPAPPTPGPAPELSWPTLDLPGRPPIAIAPPRSDGMHLDLVGLRAHRYGHHRRAHARCWEHLQQVDRTRQPLQIGLRGDERLVDDFVRAFLNSCHEAGTQRPLHLRRGEGNLPGFLRRLVGVGTGRSTASMVQGLRARGLPAALAHRVVAKEGRLDADELAETVRAWRSPSVLVICVDAWKERAAFSRAMTDVRGPVLSFWVEPDWDDPERLELRLDPPDHQVLRDTLVQSTGLGAEVVDQLADGVRTPSHASLRLASVMVRGALLRRGDRRVLRRIALPGSEREERLAQLEWMHRRWDGRQRRAMAQAALYDQVPPGPWWKQVGDPALCIDLTDSLHRARLIEDRERGWSFVHDDLRRWLQTRPTLVDTMERAPVAKRPLPGGW